MSVPPTSRTGSNKDASSKKGSSVSGGNPSSPGGSVSGGASSSASPGGAKQTDAAAEMLKQIAKYESEVGLAYDEIPYELCDGQKLDLDVWSLVAVDNSLKQISEATEERVDKKFKHMMKSLGGAVKDTRVLSVREAAKARTREQALEAVGTQELKLTGCSQVGDVGLRALGELCAPTLRVLHLSGAHRMSDVGLRCVSSKAFMMVDLDLSGCTGVEGVGLACFGENSPNLVKVNLHGCGRLQSWAFQRLVCGCPLIEELDVSQCNLLTDHDMGVLATNCPRIIRLNVKDAKQLSDIALVEVAKRCSALEWIDTSRSELPWKITDVGILGLAENCPQLKTLIAQGCDQLTDVAMAWIGRGCQALTHLDLRNCVKGSNAGVRALAEGCFALEHLDLTNMKGVTDTGVRALANNCPALKQLHLAGMFMLTDGKKRDFGLEGLQALCGHARNIELLHVSGCFQVQKGALNCVARSAFAHKLLDLNLSGCPKLDDGAFKALMKRLPNLQALSVAHCGESVTDGMVSSVGHHCRRLAKLDLTECVLLEKGGLRSVLLGCRKLVILNLTGCVKIDDFALMPLSEISQGHFNPGLEELVLAGCPLIGDTGMAWVADGLFACNVKLGLKGTKVGNGGVKSVADRWRYSDMKRTKAFFGLWPQQRWRDRVIINEYGARFKAARRIQALTRGNVGRKKAEAVKQQFFRCWVALKLQSWFRGRVARELFQLLLWEHERREHAQTVLKGYSLIIAAKERRRVLRERRDLGIAEGAAVQIQKIYRARLATKLVEMRREEARLAMLKLLRSALIVQATIRGHWGRKRFKAVLAAKIAEEARRDAACRRLQRLYRGVLVRNMVARQRVELANQIALEVRCARIVQARYRTHRMRRILRLASLQRQELLVSALKVQAAWRGKRARLGLHFMRMMLQQDLEEAAALTLTCWARVIMAKTVVREKRHKRDTFLASQGGSALTMQRCYRGYLARKRVRKMKSDQEELLRKMIELENWSAVHIQSQWRGYSERVAAARAMREHKGKWKEMWDPDKRRPFYYNQVSGEIRWRKPQALLDLMRRPICHNCEFYEAVVECQNCIEFYCNSCWETVHYSGKRRRHKFRCLYDYYEKRVDYGDNEFPSRWPTEVEQDEMIGWQLRIGESKLGEAHDRPADELRGDWECYHDREGAEALEGTHGALREEAAAAVAGPKAPKPNKRRTFFYNARTEEGTYDTPPEWHLALSDTNQNQQQHKHSYYDDSNNNNQLGMSGGADTSGGVYGGGGGYAETANTFGNEVTGWATMFDESANAEYYVNEVTGETSYDMPPELLQLQGEHGGAGGGVRGGREEVFSAAGKAATNGDWTQHFDDEFQVDYWYNTETGEASYERPAGFLS